MTMSSAHVVVMGGGVAGLSSATNLAARGVRVTLIERESALGGNATTVCCKAVNGKCQLCGACLLADALDGLRRRPEITVLLDNEVREVVRKDGVLAVTVSSPQGTHTLAADSVIVATGFDHVDAHTKGPYGYGILSNVITGEEMERRLTVEGQSAYDAVDLEKVAFIQCVGSRDEHVGRGYCSQVCCRYALRLARLLKSRHPDSDITIFKMDLQSSGRDSAEAYRAAMEEGVHLIAGIPAVVRRSAENPRRAAFLYDDILAGEISQDEFDLIVLSVGMQPRHDAADIAEMVRINQDSYGFFATREDGASTIAEGIYVAGCCAAPRSIAETVAHAGTVAEACYRYLQELGA